MAANMFSSPAYKLDFQRYSLKRSEGKFRKPIDKKCLNHAVSVLIPDHAQIPRNIASVLDNEPYWIVKNLPLSELIQREFVEAFIHKGTIGMLSVGRNVDEEDCISLSSRAFLPKAVLLLNITKDTYEELGLEGQKSKFDGKRPAKYVVKIGINSRFKPGTKYYERVKWCLTDRLGLAADFIFFWKPQDDSVCPSSLSNYFQKKGYVCPLYRLQHKLTQCSVQSRPIVDSSTVEETDFNCGYSQFWEWLAAISLGVQEGEPGDYINTMECPLPNLPMSTCVNSTYTGLIPVHRVKEVLHQCRIFLQDALIPWIALTVHGFADSPEAWEGWEHGYQSNGDNLYTVVLFPNGDYWLYIATGPKDTFC